MSEKQYIIGNLTMQFVFKPNSMTDISDLQKVFDKTEEAFVKLEPKFGGLTNAQRERLEMLAEEAAEVVQACTKILRHGYNSHHPDRPGRTNKKELQDELMQMWAVYERMAYHGDLMQINFYGSPDVWKKKMQYTHHQPPFHHPTLPRTE